MPFSRKEKPLKPAAPRSINKEALRYEQLDTLLSFKGTLTIVLGYNTVNITTLENIVREKEGSHFTLEELGAACPALKDMLIYNMKKIEHLENSWLQEGMKTIWLHCKSLSVLVKQDGLEEIYIHAPTEMYDIDFNNETVDMDCSEYRLIVKKTETSTIIQSGHIAFYSTSSAQVSMHLLETIYPGFRDSIKVGVGLGLSDAELANFACKRDSSLAVGFSATNTKPLPSLS